MVCLTDYVKPSKDRTNQALTKVNSAECFVGLELEYYQIEVKLTKEYTYFVLKVIKIRQEQLTGEAVPERCCNWSSLQEHQKYRTIFFSVAAPCVYSIF